MLRKVLFSHSLLHRKEGSRKSGTSRGLFRTFLARFGLPFPGMKSSPLSAPKPALQSVAKTFPSLLLLFLFSPTSNQHFFVSPRVASSPRKKNSDEISMYIPVRRVHRLTDIRIIIRSKTL